MDEKELEILIPSEYVRSYVKETGWVFTDMQKAALLFHGDLPLKEQYSHLQRLQNNAADQTVKRQIAAYLNKTEQDFQAFKENSDRRHIYILKVKEEDKSYSRIFPDGYFFDWQMAYEYGKKEKLPFEIEKHFVGDIKILDKYENSEYYDYEIAYVTFNKDGEALGFESWELSNDDEEFDFYECFQSTFYEVPNPFERGDVVNLVGTEDYGIVDTSQKIWKENLAKYKTSEWIQKGIGPDYSDVQIRVEFLNDDGTFSHAHINPIYLERYQPEKYQTGKYWQSNPRDTLLWYAGLVYRGEGSLDELYIFTMGYRRDKGK